MLKVIAVDFDGTLFDHKYPAIGAYKEGAREALEMFRDLGFHVLIYSCRTCKWFPEVFATRLEDGSIDPRWHSSPMNRVPVADMIAALAEHNIPYDEIDDGSKGKPLADFYIDDKGIRFQNNWPQIAAWVRTIAA